MAKAFISFLGTNDYLPCVYHFEDHQKRNTRFVQEATIEFCCSQWNEDDRILIFITDEALRKNWHNNGHTGRDGEPLIRKGLEQCIKELNVKPRIHPVTIPSGKSETEIWRIFEIVFNHLNTDDEVVFDVTHALRSIPMLAMVVLNYAKVAANIRLQGIYYGAFEALGSIQDALKIEPENRHVPIFDLTAFDNLLGWAMAIDRFLGAGDAKPASQLALQTVAPILKESRGQDMAAKAMRNIANKLNDFSQKLATCRGPLISSVVDDLKQSLTLSQDDKLLGPMQPLLKKIRKGLDAFNGQMVGDGIEAARWCLEHNLIQQGYTILLETLISYFIIQIDEDPIDYTNQLRAIAPQAISIFQNDRPESEWLHPSKNRIEVTKKFIELYNSENKLLKVYNKLSQLRNDLNHAGYRSNAKSANSFGRELEKLLQQTESLISR